MPSRTVNSRRSEFRNPTNVARNGRLTSRVNRAINEVGASHHSFRPQQTKASIERTTIKRPRNNWSLEATHHTLL